MGPVKSACVLFFCLLLAGCTSAPSPDQATQIALLVEAWTTATQEAAAQASATSPSVFPSPALQEAARQPSAAPQPALPPPATITMTLASSNSGWQMLRPGLERRSIEVRAASQVLLEQLHLLRLDSAAYRFDIAYHAAAPQSLEAWQQETGALVIVNGGYYRLEDERYLPAGLLVVAGQPLGESYGAFAGMLAITSQGFPRLRWLQQEPYSASEGLHAALQSFPLLIKPGGELGFPAQYEDGLQARRTVVGQDRLGRIVFLVADTGNFTLHQLSAYLYQSDLGLDIALNLDGGPSSGLLLSEPFELFPALNPLPLVIAVYPR